MFKKTLLLLALLFCSGLFSNTAFSSTGDEQQATSIDAKIKALDDVKKQAKTDRIEALKKQKKTQEDVNAAATNTGLTSDQKNKIDEANKTAISQLTEATNKLTEVSNTLADTKLSDRNSKCDSKEVGEDGKQKNCIDRASFTIDVSTLVPGLEKENVPGGDKKVANLVTGGLGKIIQVLLGSLTAISVLIMVVGAGYMIVYSGQDELLSKGKSIFTAGIIATVVALSSYYLVSLVRFILF